MGNVSIHLTDSEIDELLFAQLNGRWQKVAMVVAKAMEPYESWDEERIGQRILALIRSGKAEHQGDVRDWRHSEIRLKQSDGTE